MEIMESQERMSYNFNCKKAWTRKKEGDEVQNSPSSLGSRTRTQIP